MAVQPMRAHVSTSALSIPLPEPVTGDPYTHLASTENAALAVAAAYECLNADESTVPLLTGLTVSPVFLAAKACYRRDLKQIESEQPADAADREDFCLDLLLCRMYLGGMMQARLPKEARHA